MKQVNKKLYIITTRLLNRGGFLNDQECIKKEACLDSPLMNYFFNDDDEVLVSWLYALSGDSNNEKTNSIRELLGLKDVSQLGETDFIFNLITEKSEKKEALLSIYGKDLMEFLRDNIETPVDGINCATYYEIELDDLRIIALPHLVPGKNKCQEDNKRWINALIDTFARIDENVRLVLHNKDVYGYSDESMGYQLQTKESTMAISGRDDIEIYLFRHDDGPIARCLSISHSQEGIQMLERVFHEGMLDRML